MRSHGKWKIQFFKFPDQSTISSLSTWASGPLILVHHVVFRGTVFSPTPAPPVQISTFTTQNTLLQPPSYSSFVRYGGD